MVAHEATRIYKVYFTRNQVPLYLWQIKSTQNCDIVSIEFFPRLFLHENDVENYLTKFKFTPALIKVKLRNYFLK